VEGEGGGERKGNEKGRFGSGGRVTCGMFGMVGIIGCVGIVGRGGNVGTFGVVCIR